MVSVHISWEEGQLQICKLCKFEIKTNLNFNQQQ